MAHWTDLLHVLIITAGQRAFELVKLDPKIGAELVKNLLCTPGGSRTHNPVKATGFEPMLYANSSTGA